MSSHACEESIMVLVRLRQAGRLYSRYQTLVYMCVFFSPLSTLFPGVEIVRCLPGYAGKTNHVPEEAWAWSHRTSGCGSRGTMGRWGKGEAGEARTHARTHWLTSLKRYDSPLDGDLWKDVPVVYYFSGTRHKCLFFLFFPSLVNWSERAVQVKLE